MQVEKYQKVGLFISQLKAEQTKFPFKNYNNILKMLQKVFHR